jgi:acyl carrier protein
METVSVSEAASPAVARPGSRQEVEAFVRRMVVEVLMLKDVTPEGIDAEREDFLVDIGANSIDALELIVAIEERLMIEFTDAQMNADLVKTLNHFVGAICEKLGLAAPAPVAS